MDQVKRKRVVLRRSAFRSWLSSRSSDIVGYACESVSCPLSWWVQDVYSVSCEVGMDVYEVSGSTTYTLPAWAKAFVRVLDFTYPFLNGVKGVEALSLLDNAERVLVSGSPDACLSSVEV